uniref:Phosphatidylinositol glycan anchor biosynthesis class Y n=1 Tax=Cyanistes caeruleus TaxID=156563 RepID=A0A8C0VLW1_CYACU
RHLLEKDCAPQEQITSWIPFRPPKRQSIFEANLRHVFARAQDGGKESLRYEEATNELINEELGIAYPIIDGIPNMVPEAARMMHKKPPAEGLFYSASVDETFPQGCTSTTSLCFYSLLLPVTVPVYVFFHLWTWMGIKLFRHN